MGICAWSLYPHYYNNDIRYKNSTIKVVKKIMIIILIIVIIIIIIMMIIIFMLKLLYHNLQIKRKINYDMTHDAIILKREDYG